MRRGVLFGVSTKGFARFCVSDLDLVLQPA